MRRAILTDKLTGEKHACHATTDHPSSAYGQAVWVDDETGVAYTQVDLPAIVEIPWTIEETRRYSAQISKILRAIQQRAEERGLSAYRIAKDTDIALGSVKRILTSDETDVRLSLLTKITDYLGLSIEVK